MLVIVFNYLLCYYSDLQTASYQVIQIFLNQTLIALNSLYTIQIYTIHIIHHSALIIGCRETVFSSIT